MRRLVDVVLQFIERLPAYPNDVILKTVAMEREVVSEVRAGAASLIAVCLARKPTFVRRVPQHAVGGVDMKSRRNDLLKSVSDQSSKIVRIHGDGVYGSDPLGVRGAKGDPRSKEAAEPIVPPPIRVRCGMPVHEAVAPVR